MDGSARRVGPPALVTDRAPGHNRQVWREVGSLAAGIDASTGHGGGPAQLPGGELKPGSGVCLHDVRGRATAVPGPRHALDRTEWRHAHFHCPARYLLGQQSERVADRSAQRGPKRLGPGRSGGANGREASRPEGPFGRHAAKRPLAGGGPLLVDGSQQPPKIRTPR